jgi:hypothetical protein
VSVPRPRRSVPRAGRSTGPSPGRSETYGKVTPPWAGTRTLGLLPLGIRRRVGQAAVERVMMIYRLWAPRARMPCPCASKEESIKLRGQMGRGTTPRRRMASFAAAKAGYHFRKVAVSSALMPFMRGLPPVLHALGPREDGRRRSGMRPVARFRSRVRAWTGSSCPAAA